MLLFANENAVKATISGTPPHGTPPQTTLGVQRKQKRPKNCTIKPLYSLGYLRYGPADIFGRYANLKFTMIRNAR